jgi:polyphosphate kinase 2
MTTNKIPINSKGKLANDFYIKEIESLQIELVKLQYWIKETNAKVVVIFEGRDAAGKGGAIKRIAQCLNPRICNVVALGTPTERDKSQWYFQRYTHHLPASSEMVLFDRSWYNRGGVEKVMDFCTDEEYWEFLRSCPSFENMLIRSGIILIKYWFSVSEKEQEKRFKSRISDPTKRWKISPIDIESMQRYTDYSKAKDEMFTYTDTEESPWYMVNADNKKKARLNCINHLLSMIPYQKVEMEDIELPPRVQDDTYDRPPLDKMTFIPEVY